MWQAICLTLAAPAGNNIGKVFQKKGTTILPPFSFKLKLVRYDVFFCVLMDIVGALLLLCALSLAPKAGSPCERNVVRCGLWWAEMLKSWGQYREAATVYLRISREESSLLAAAMLEQSSYCYLHCSPPLLRKHGFHLVLAGDCYELSDQNLGRTYKVFQLQLPSISMQSINVIFEDHRTYASPSSVLVMESFWLSLEEELIPSISTFQPTWLDSRSKPSTHMKFKDFALCVSREAITVEIEFVNPLQTPLSISDVSLLCELCANSDASRSGTIKSHPIGGRLFENRWC